MKGGPTTKDFVANSYANHNQGFGSNKRGAKGSRRVFLT